MMAADAAVMSTGGPGGMLHEMPPAPSQTPNIYASPYGPPGAYAPSHQALSHYPAWAYNLGPSSQHQLLT